MSMLTAKPRDGLSSYVATAHKTFYLWPLTNYFPTRCATITIIAMLITTMVIIKSSMMITALMTIKIIIISITSYD